jgi:hypothetical protein
MHFVCLFSSGKMAASLPAPKLFQLSGDLLGHIQTFLVTQFLYGEYLPSSQKGIPRTSRKLKDFDWLITDYLPELINGFN